MAIKHKQYNELGDPVPGPWSWGCSCFALFLMLLSMLWGQLAATGLRYARLQENFAHLARGGNDLQRLLADERFDPIYEQHSDAFKALIPVITFVNRGDLGKALETLQRKDSPHHPLLKRLEVRLEELASADSDFEAASEEESQSAPLHNSLVNSYQEILEQLYQSLLGETVPVDHPDLHGFYESGILRDLPLVKGIPDNVSSLENLQMFARQYRDGRDRDRRLFERNLELLRGRSEILKPQIEDYLVRADSRQKKLKRLSGTRGASIQEAQIILVKVLVEFTRVIVSPSLVQAYQQFSDALDPFGVSLPELRIG